MATKTYRAGSGADGSYAALFEADQTAATRADGWTVAKIAAGNSSEMDVGFKRTSGTFTLQSSFPKPLTPGQVTFNGFKTPVALSGTFAATAWTFTFAVRATTASAQAGRMRLRVFRSVNASGAGATELTGSTQVGTTSSALSTSADVTTVVTWTPGATITLNGEFLFFVLAWEIMTAGGSNSCDVSIRTGQAAGGSRLITPDFVADVSTPISGTDSQGTEIETVTLAGQIASVDASGTITEIADAVPQAPPVTKPAFTVRSSMLRSDHVLRGITEVAPTAVAGSDSGSGADSQSLVAGISATDTNGSFTEAAALVARPAAIDANSVLAEAQALASQIAGTDVDGVNPEVIVQTAQIPSSDSGTSSESQATAVPTQKADSDTNGTTTETSSAGISIPGSDSNSVTSETAAIRISGVSDSAVATDVISALKLLVTDVNGATTETGVAGSTPISGGVDASTAPGEVTSLLARIGGTEAATCSETASVSTFTQVAGTDSNQITTEIVSSFRLTAADTSGTATENASSGQQTQVSGNDSASGSESLSQPLVAVGDTQTASGAETASLRLLWLPGDTSTSSEVGLVVGKLAQADSGAGSETTSTRITYIVTDATSPPVEAAFLAVVTADQGISTDVASLLAGLYGQDQATSSEIAVNDALVSISPDADHDLLGTGGAEAVLYSTAAGSVGYAVLKAAGAEAVLVGAGEMNGSTLTGGGNSDSRLLSTEVR
jgi:hypothetical protein